MLDVEPSNRPTAVQILEHPWMTSANPATTHLIHQNTSIVKVNKNQTRTLVFTLIQGADVKMEIPVLVLAFK